MLLKSPAALWIRIVVVIREPMPGVVHGMHMIIAAGQTFFMGSAKTIEDFAVYGKFPECYAGR